MEKYVRFHHFTHCDPFSEHNYRVNRGIHLEEYDQEIFYRNGWHNYFVDALTQDPKLRKEDDAKLNQWGYHIFEHRPTDQQELTTNKNTSSHRPSGNGS
jgi:hypothetical protein